MHRSQCAELHENDDAQSSMNPSQSVAVITGIYGYMDIFSGRDQLVLTGECYFSTNYY